MQVLVIDVGGSHVKILGTGQERPRGFASEASMTAKKMVSKTLKAAEGWKYDVARLDVSDSLPQEALAEPSRAKGSLQTVVQSQTESRPRVPITIRGGSSPT